LQLEASRLLQRVEADVAIAIRERRLLPGSFALLRAAFLEGEIARGKLALVTGYQDRQVRSVLKRLLEERLVVSDSLKGPVQLGFPTVAAEKWLPRLWAD
jgi:predicted transcriptional regulator